MNTSVPGVKPKRRALYLHGGMPRTATSSLQMLLAAEAEELRKAGFSYPEAGRDSGNIAHHELMLDIVSSDEKKPLQESFLRSVKDVAEDVILSSEAAIYGFGADRLPALISFLRKSLECRETYFVYALRRMDEYCESVYVQEVRSSDLGLSLEQYAEKTIRMLPGFFKALIQIADTVGEGALRLVKFQKNSIYFEEMFDALGLDYSRYSGSRIPPVVNETFSLKGQVALTHHRKLSAEFGFDVRRYRLWIAVQHKLLRLKEDPSRYHLMDCQLAERIHEAALDAARKTGHTRYVEFFAQEVPTRAAVPLTLDYGHLTSEDKLQIKRVLLSLVERHGLEHSAKYDD